MHALLREGTWLGFPFYAVFVFSPLCRATPNNRPSGLFLLYNDVVQHCCCACIPYYWSRRAAVVASPRMHPGCARQHRTFFRDSIMRSLVRGLGVPSSTTSFLYSFLCLERPMTSTQWFLCGRILWYLGMFAFFLVLKKLEQSAVPSRFICVWRRFRPLPVVLITVVVVVIIVIAHFVVERIERRTEYNFSCGCCCCSYSYSYPSSSSSSRYTYIGGSGTSLLMTMIWWTRLLANSHYSSSFSTSSRPVLLTLLLLFLFLRFLLLLLLILILLLKLLVGGNYY